VHKQKETSKCSIFATKGIIVLSTSILSTAFTTTLAKLHWLKINAYMGCICIFTEHLSLSWKTRVDVFTKFTFRIIKLHSQPFVHIKELHFSISLAIAFAILVKPHTKTSVVTGKIMKTTELYHTRMPLPLNNFVTFFRFTL
jgi:hypothetical protein